MSPTLREKLKTSIVILLWIAVYLGVAGIIGNMTREEIPLWYRGLAKPPLNPPDFIFPIVWTTLYIMMAIAGWRIWNSKNKTALFLFSIQTIMNWAWSYFFFDFHFLGFSFAWIIGLVLCVSLLIVSIYKTNRLSAVLLIPYLFWIGFASYLNGMIWHLN